MDIGHRVLIVDDEPSFLAVMRRLVQRLRPDAVVVYAADAAAAEWQLQETDVCLVLTDMCLISGARAGMRVVNAARQAGVPVAVLTGARGTWVEELAQVDVAILDKAALTSDRIAELIERHIPTS